MVEAETIVQVVNAGVVLISSFYLYREIKNISPLGWKEKLVWGLFGSFFVGVGLPIGWPKDRTVIDAILLKYIGLGESGIVIGYIFWMVLIAILIRDVIRQQSGTGHD